MSFAVDAEAYDRFMGRYSRPLSSAFATFLHVAPGDRVLDVGCGPGAFVAELVGRVGPEAVAAVDPSSTFVTAARTRFPGVDVRSASAETLPFADDTFDVAGAQLVVHFIADPVRALGEMARVTQAGGTVGATVWDFAGGRAPISAFWDAATRILGTIDDESELAGARAGELASLLASAGLRDVEEDELTISVRHGSFDEWWEPFTLGVGPAGAAAAALEPAELDAVRERCREVLGAGPFELGATAWAARGTVSA